MPMKYEDRVRLIIKNHLSALEIGLRHLERTLPGCLFPNGCSLSMVCEALAECGKNPSPYTVNTLEQTVRAFISMCDYPEIEVG